MMSVREMLMEYAYGGLRQVFAGCGIHLEQAQEIRIRLGLPLAMRTSKGEVLLGNGYKPTAKDITGTLDKMTNHSLYAFDSEIRNGFITIAGGHRVGICGRVALDGGKIKTIRHISGLTVRVARQVIGAADEIAGLVCSENGGIHSTLIVSPPGQGKTTVLRDLIRQLSNKGYNVAVVDERSEIAGSHNGAAQNDLGIRADVLDGAPKAEGMLLMLRAMSPDIIAVDEIGSDEDVLALLTVACCGAKIIATLHGENVEDLRRKPAIAPLLDSRIFGRYIFLTNKSKAGRLKAAYDEDLQEVIV
ncbi:MAG: stage III sporulation protein AA [Defluviitaleaceae bacterium]|nr:stage III sporulation protein AA [Defluviitaleaceae bacterium]